MASAMKNSHAGTFGTTMGIANATAMIAKDPSSSLRRPMRGNQIGDVHELPADPVGEIAEEHPADENPDQTRSADKSDLCRRQRQGRLQGDQRDADDRQRIPIDERPARRVQRELLMEGRQRRIIDEMT